MKYPILLIAFARPDTTSLVIQSIKEAKPSKLYIALDAPRPNRPGEVERHNKVKELLNNTDWEFDVKYYCQRNNQGCSKGPYKAISWFFENEEAGIIIEDDIVPTSDFYIFCDNMLDTYKKNEKIQSISGWSYFYHDIPVHEYSYYFSHFTSSWGWASWRRVWEDMDLKLENIDRQSILNKMKQYGFPWRTRLLFISYFDKIKENFESLQSWDYQFLFSMWSKDRMVVQPFVSTVKNIGNKEGATHKFSDKLSEYKTYPLKDIQIPNTIESNISYDLLRISNEDLYWKPIIYWKMIGLKNKIFRKG